MSDSSVLELTQVKDFEQLEEIQEFIFKEFKNINKSRYRTRSKQGIFHKREALNAAIEEFEHIVKKYENLDDTVIWNELTDRLEIIKVKHRHCLQLLEQTKPIEDSVFRSGTVRNLRNRRVSCNESISEETEKLTNFKVSISGTDLYFGPIRDPNILSSTVIDDNDSDSDAKTSALNALRDFSLKFDKVYKSYIAKMAYEFPTTKAIQCIPEFRGATVELDGFLFQIEHFANALPKKREDQPDNPVNTAERELIYVVLSKLKGPAAAQFKRINAETWREVRDNLQKEFGDNLKLEEVFRKVETLEQGPTETFQSYKDRTLILKAHIDEYEKNHERLNNDNETYAHRNLRLHFLGGLKNRNLKTLAKSHKGETLEDLMEYLEEECIDVEQIEHIEKRLQDCHIAESQRQRSKDSKHYRQQNNFENFRGNNDHHRNRAFNSEPNDHQRNWSHDRNERPQGGYSNNYPRNINFGGQNDYRNFNRNQNNYYPRNERERFSGNDDSYRNYRDRYESNWQRNDRHQFESRNYRSNDNTQNNSRDYNRNEPPRQDYRSRNNDYRNNGRYEQGRENNWNDRNYNNNQEQKN